jgi:hypothetical protein
MLVCQQRLLIFLSAAGATSVEIPSIKGVTHCDGGSLFMLC